MCDVMQLPKELLYFILAKVDGNSLCMVERTCREWHSIVRDLELHFNVWLRCCLREIPNEILVKISGTTQFHNAGETNSMSMNEFTQFHWMFWKQIYVVYIRYGNVNKWNVHKKEISLKNSEYGIATALELKDNFLVSGHKDGSVVLWENLKANEHDRFVCKHLRDVSDIKVITEGDGKDLKVIVSSSLSSRVKIVDVMKEVNNDHSVEQLFPKQVNAVSVWGPYFVAAANSSMVDGQKVEVICSPTSTDVAWELHGHETSDLSAVAMWADEVVTGDFAGNLMSWKLKPDQVTNSEPVLLAQFEVSVKYICLQGKNLVVLLGDGSICFCGKDREFRTILRRTLFAVLGGTPDCIALYGPLLAVCVTFGSFYLYYIPDDECWKTLDLTVPLTKVCTEKSLITAISLGDDGHGPMVAVATDDGAVSIYKWRPP